MWTDQQQQILVSGASQSLPARDIGALLGMSKNAVIGRARRTGVKLAEPQAARDPALVAMVRKLYDEGRSYSEIARLSGVPADLIAPLTVGCQRRKPRAGAAIYCRKVLKLRALVYILMGEKRPRVAKRLRLPMHVFKAWEKETGLLDEARAIASRKRALSELRLAREVAAYREAMARRAEQIDALNGPLIVSLSARSRDILQRRLRGETLSQLGERHGVTRERIRQILCGLRLQGIVTDLDPLH